MGQMSKRKALKLLKKLLDDRKKGTGMYDIYPERRKKWERNARVTVQAVFGEHSGHIEETVSCFKQRDPWRYPDRCATLLESMIYEVENTWPSGGERVSSSGPVQHDDQKVFLVHGHDGEVKETVARFLEKKKLEVVILDEIAGKGRTIIEKFEEHSSVSYAVVLMTPDDSTEPRKGGVPKSRARQNVVFELGFFVGALNRGRVCVIAKGNVEMHSNYWGVEYIPWDDAGGWKLKLLEELKAANLAVSEG